MSTNILFCSAGRRTKLLQFFRESLDLGSQIIAVDNQSTAPALYFSDRQYIVPRITDPGYVDLLIEICKKDNVKAITTLIDPEIELLAQNNQLFKDNGVLVLSPSLETARYCFDKYALFVHLTKHGIPTVLTYDSLESFMKGYSEGKIQFPVFIKPRTGSGSVGIHKVANLHELKKYLDEGAHQYIIQEFMDCRDCDADVYVDTISHKPVSIFTKNKIETRIGGANKTISFKDEKLFEFIKKICTVLEFNGPVDMDFWYRDGMYYLSEVNPRFGGAYLHAHGCGVNFIQLIVNNINGIENEENIGDYKEDVLMMMYDDVVIIDKKDLVSNASGKIEENKKKIAIYGAGGFGREVAGAINRINKSKREHWEIVGFYDDNKPVGTEISHYGKVLGGMADVNKVNEPMALTIAVGNPSARKHIYESITNPLITFPNIIAPSFKVLDPDTFKIGRGNIIQDNCSVTCDVTIGDFNVLNGSDILGHDDVIGDFNVLMPGVHLSGEVSIGMCNLLGVGSIVLQQRCIGHNVKLGAGSVLMTKPKDGCTYIGVPAKKFDFK